MSQRARANYRRNQRREAAEVRQEAHNKLSIEQKIAKLDKKLGNNQGAQKERKKLKEQLADV